MISLRKWANMRSLHGLSAADSLPRYPFANWNVIPLNPAISAEYIFGVGKSVKDATSERDLHRQPDAVSVPLLLGQNFGDHFGYRMNVGVEQDVSRDSGREFDISQTHANSQVVPLPACC
jgi:hypothetical protein